ncbi:MAG: helix-turn-helix transcriptional regulator [Erysipelotrichaceae bacterium]|nr:helix-turn-helix transcriptional regulator [Erysipelotrichaceae bacterium]
MELKELRKQKGLTQIDCAKYLGMPIRTYQNYENDSADACTALSRKVNCILIED